MSPRQGRWPRLRRAAGKLALLAVSTLVALLLVEGVVRVAAPQQLIQLRPDVWMPHDGFGNRLRPGVDTTVNTGEGTVRLLTDEDGHRVGPAVAEEPSFRVLVLGDSFVEALQVPWEETLTGLLERRLSRALGRPGRVVNTGVSGWNPNHYLMEARRELAHRRYDAVVTCVFLGNDLLYGRHDHHGPWQPARRRPLRLPRAFEREEWIDAVAYPVNDVLERRSHTFVLVKRRAKFLLLRLGLSKYTLPRELRTDLRGSPQWQLTAEALRDLDLLAGERGVPHLVVLLPFVGQVDAAVTRDYLDALGVEPEAVDLDQPNRLLGERLRGLGVPFLDLLPHFRRAAADGPALYGRVDTHLSADGHKLVAKLLEPGLVDAITRRRDPREASP